MIQDQNQNITTFSQSNNNIQTIIPTEDKPKSKAKAAFIALLLLLILIITLYFLPKTIVIFSRANSTSSNIYSLDNSYLFASPIQAKANNADKVRITAFILDSRGLGVSNRQVSLHISDDLNNNHVQAITDSNGKAIFDISTSKPGTYEISALTDNEKIPQQVKVVFY